MWFVSLNGPPGRLTISTVHHQAVLFDAGGKTQVEETKSVAVKQGDQVKALLETLSALVNTYALKMHWYGLLDSTDPKVLLLSKPGPFN